MEQWIAQVLTNFEHVHSYVPQKAVSNLGLTQCIGPGFFTSAR